MALIFENYIKGDKQAFITRLKEVVGNLGIDPNWLMAVIYKESKFDPAAQNPSGATGLIQFMPTTAQGLGTTTASLKTMDSVAQLKYVEKYYAPYAGVLVDYPSLYLATFFPAALGKTDNHIMQTSKLSAGTIAGQNPGIDLDKNGVITVGEFKNYCYRNFSADIVNILKKKDLLA
jgi:hypothetical protein